MNRKFNGRVIYLYLVIFLVAMGSSPVIAKVNCNKLPDHPTCTDPDPEPGLTQPAFAYYCKSNPNSGAVCLANEDGSSPVKIFTTSKFQGDNFNIAAFQGTTVGNVMVEDKDAYWSIEYTVDEDGFLVSVEDPKKLIEDGLGTMDLSPFGDDFAFISYSPYGVYLGSRIDDFTGNRGDPIVGMPASPLGELDYEGLKSPAWSVDGQTIYFIKSSTIVDGPWWHEVHMAEIGTEGTQGETQCILASREAPYEDGDTSYCSKIDYKLTRFYFISHSDDGLMVSARGMDLSGSDPEEIYYTYIFDGQETWVEIPTPEFIGHDWTADGTIIGQTDDDELLTFDPETGDISILIKKNATSPDWNN